MKNAILVFACIFSMCVKPPQHVSVSDKSIQNFANSSLDKNWKVLSIGGFYHLQKVEHLYLDLQYQGTMEDKEAEKKLSTFIRGMIRHINKDTELLPFLAKHRFSVQDISISIAYQSPQGISSQIHLYKGKIVFSTYDDKTNNLEENYSKSISDLYAQI